MKKTQEYREYKEQTQEQLLGAILEKRAELYTLRCEYEFARKLEKPHKLRSLRREVARVMTELSSRKLKDSQA